VVRAKKGNTHKKKPPSTGGPRNKKEKNTQQSYRKNRVLGDESFRTGNGPMKKGYGKNGVDSL